MSKAPPSLEPAHWRYIQLRLLGATNPEAAKELNIDGATAWRWGQMPQVKDELSKLQADAIESTARIVRAGLARAARRVNELVDSPDENVALRAATWVLERVPEPPAETVLAEVASTGNPWDAE